MTDRLSTMLHDEATLLAVPPVDAAAVLGEGRQIRRQHQLRTVVATFSAIVVVAALVATATGFGHRQHDIAPADQLAYEQQGAWADAHTVHIGAHVADVQDTVLIRYSSEGALVSSFDYESDTQKTADVTLVRPDGTTQSLGAIGIVASEPDQSEVVYAKDIGDNQMQLIVVDLADGSERELGDPFDVGGYMYDVTMAGPYVLFTGNTLEMLNWHTGEKLTPPVDYSLYIAGPQDFNRAGVVVPKDFVQQPTTAWQLLSLQGGEVLRTFEDGGAERASMSPDGRYLLVGDKTSSFVYDVATGERLPLTVPATPLDTGWTPDGHVLSTSGPHGTGPVVVCAPEAGTCDQLEGTVDPETGLGVKFGS